MLQSPALQAARRLLGVKAGPMPGFVEPSLATLRPEAPRGDRWVHEIKYDGYRLQLHVHNGRIRLFTRRGHNWTDRFESIVIAASSVKTYAAILDGEVIVPTEQGRSDFHALERDLGAGRSDRFVYYCFDPLYLDGLDLRACALLDRKDVLAELLVGVPPPLGFSEHLGADGRDVLANACRLELEGVVSKLKDGRYRSGRNDDWVKATCRHRDTFAIAGWAEKQGKFDGLYLARNEEGELAFRSHLDERDDGGSGRRLHRPAARPYNPRGSCGRLCFGEGAGGTERTSSKQPLFAIIRCDFPQSGHSSVTGN
jgi:bifunctional non-homologous end joining protein LigD